MNCKMCENMCPAVCLTRPYRDVGVQSYAAAARDEYIRKESSSGGIFTVFSKYFLRQGGIVFGAAFLKNFHAVQHISVKTEAELQLLRGSKYMQSRIENTYKEAETALIQGRKVLFTGTPCQIAGLKSFLNQEYDGLYSLAVACYGVPAPFVWSEYLDYLECRYGGYTTNVSFRNKDAGWKKYRIKIQFSNGRQYRKTYSSDLYMRGFLRGYYLRPSCYACKFKGVNSYWDIMLADMWGLEEVCPEFNDDRGTSLIITSTEKGEHLLDKVKANVEVQSVDMQRAISFNPAIQSSTVETSERKAFETAFSCELIERLLGKYCRDSAYREFKRWLKNII